MDERLQSERDRRVLDPALARVRSLLYRNIISGVLLVVAVAGILTESDLIRRGFVTNQTRLVLAAYVLIALYAAASLYLRLRVARRR